jgi:ribonuclease H / adenosylcobalamin/alpha-ribazole phosphatase
VTVVPRHDEVILVRHAATSWSGLRFCGRSDPPLSQSGTDATARLAADLGAVAPGARIVTSPLRRALQTAEPIARVIGGRLEVDERWRETDFGDAEGLTFDEVQRRWPALARALLAGDTEIDWPGGERHRDLVARVESAWADLTSDVGGGRSIVVSHGGPIMAVLRLVSGASAAAAPTLEPGSIARLRRSAGDSWQPLPAVAATLGS